MTAGPSPIAIGFCGRTPIGSGWYAKLNQAHGKSTRIQQSLPARITRDCGATSRLVENTTKTVAAGINGVHRQNARAPAEKASAPVSAFRFSRGKEAPPPCFTLAIPLQITLARRSKCSGQISCNMGSLVAYKTIGRAESAATGFSRGGRSCQRQGAKAGED